MPRDNKPAATTRASLERIKRVCDRVEGRAIGGGGQKRRRAIGGGGGAAVADADQRLARVTTPITAATNNLSANWGEGYVVYLDETTGAELDMPPAVVRNPLPFAFVLDAMVELRGTVVRNGTCAAYPWAE